MCKLFRQPQCCVEGMQKNIKKNLKEVTQAINVKSYAEAVKSDINIFMS